MTNTTTAHLFTVHATALDHNGVRIPATQEEVLGDLFGALFATQAQCISAIAVADFDTDVECEPHETILPRVVAWAQSVDGDTYYGVDDADASECVDDEDVTSRGTSELADDFRSIEHTVLLGGHGGPRLTKALRTWRTA